MGWAEHHLSNLLSTKDPGVFSGLLFWRMHKRLGAACDACDRRLRLRALNAVAALHVLVVLRLLVLLPQRFLATQSGIHMRQGLPALARATTKNASTFSAARGAGHERGQPHA